MSASQEKPKDPLFSFRSTMVDKDSKGRDRLRLYMDSEQIPTLIEVLQTHVDSPRGVKLTFHTGEKVAEATGRPFLSTFGFVSGVQDGPGGAKAPVTKTFTRRAAATALGQKPVE